MKLPSEAFASRYEEPEGMLNLAAPTFGNKNFTLNSTIIDDVKLYEYKQVAKLKQSINKFQFKSGNI